MYVALAEALGAVLITTDRRLCVASSPRCEVEVLPKASDR
jgi:predicted nucleic acid-binding protein